MSSDSSIVCGRQASKQQWVWGRQQVGLHRLRGEGLLRCSNEEHGAVGVLVTAAFIIMAGTPSGGGGGGGGGGGAGALFDMQLKLLLLVDRAVGSLGAWCQAVVDDSGAFVWIACVPTLPPPPPPNTAGKTSLLLRFCEDRFSSVFISTVGVDFKSKIVPLEGERVKLQVWDTGTCCHRVCCWKRP